jgi:hypothetical protein
VTRSFSIFAVLLTLSGCIREDADEHLDAGYSDGYAVGYNTECKIRATLIEGDFDNADYSRGYYAGLADGAAACRRDS